MKDSLPSGVRRCHKCYEITPKGNFCAWCGSSQNALLNVGYDVVCKECGAMAGHHLKDGSCPPSKEIA